MAHTLEDYLTQVHLEMRKRGLPEMDDETVRELSKHLQHPQVMQGFQSGQLTPKYIVDEVQAALQATAEGGLIGDSAGQGTAKIRSQLGFQPQQQSAGLPPGGGSRIYGQNQLALSGSAINALPATPGDQTIQYPRLLETPQERARRLRIGAI